jgi:hypothetical protein
LQFRLVLVDEGFKARLGAEGRQQGGGQCQNEQAECQHDREAKFGFEFHSRLRE